MVMSQKQQFRVMVQEAPTYVPGASIAHIKKEYGLDDVIKLASNENPLGPAVPLQDLALAYNEYYPDVSCSPLVDSQA